MAVPAKKRKAPGPAKPGRVRAPEADDADLEAFRAMRNISRRATAKELDELIRPEE
jgi:hypothetical protein